MRPVALTRDKLAMRDLLRCSGIPTVRYCRCDSPRDVEVLIGLIGGPVVVKPARGAGSAGVNLVDAAGGAAAAWAAANGASAAQPVIAEEYVGGAEVSVDTMSYDGRHEVVAIAEKVTTGRPHFVELGHQVPARLDPPQVARIGGLVLHFLDLIGQVQGPAHTELKIDGERLVLIESQTRTGGDQIWELNRLATGYDMHRASLRHLLLGERPRPGRLERAAAVRFFTAAPGVVSRVAGAEEAVEAEGVSRLKLDVAVGGTVGPLDSSQARLGYVVCEGPDVGTAVQRAERAKCMVCIEIVPAVAQTAPGVPEAAAVGCCDGSPASSPRVEASPHG